MLTLAGQEWQLQTPAGRPNTSSVNISRLDTSFNKQWPGPFRMRHCPPCFASDVIRTVCV